MSRNPRYQKQWRYNRAIGRPTSPVEATPTRERVLWLNGAGFPLDSIATAANVSAAIVERIARGTHPTVQLRTAHRLAQVTPAHIFALADPAQNVPIYATRRRVQALHRIGWRTVDIDNAIGRRLVQGNIYRGAWVYARTHRAIADVYDTLHMRPGPSARTIARSIDLGYPPPLAWDDIDDPDATPLVDEAVPEWAAHLGACTARYDADPIAIERALAGERVTLTPLERHLAIVIGTERDFSSQALADLLDTTQRTVLRHRALHASTCTVAENERTAA